MNITITYIVAIAYVFVAVCVAFVLECYYMSDWRRRLDEIYKCKKQSKITMEHICPCDVATALGAGAVWPFCILIAFIRFVSLKFAKHVLIPVADFLDRLVF